MIFFTKGTYVIMLLIFGIMSPAWSSGSRSRLANWPEDTEQEKIFVDDEEQLMGELDFFFIDKRDYVLIESELYINSLMQFENSLVYLKKYRALEVLTLKFARIPLRINDFKRLIKIISSMPKLNQLTLYFKFNSNFEADGLKLLTTSLLRMPKLKKWNLVEAWDF